MSSNIIGPFPNKKDAPSEDFEKTSEDLYDTETILVANIDTVVKKWELKQMWLRKPTHLLYQQNMIPT